ncbi:unnamed protein product [Ectocarpus fasciculatus]
MGTSSPAVVDVFRCIESVEKRRNEVGTTGSGSGGKDESSRRGKRRSQAADRALRERYYAVLQRKDRSSLLSQRIKTLRRMVLAQGLPGDVLEHCTTPRSGSSGAEQRNGPEATTTAPPPPPPPTTTTTTTTTTRASSLRSSPSSARHQQQQQPGGRRGARGSSSGGGGGGGGGGSATSGGGGCGGFTSGGSGTSGTAVSVPAADPTGEDHQCSLRGLVWKVLLGTIHTDSTLYIRLVAKGPSSEDVKIKEDTFRTFPRDEEFRRRVHEDKLSRINNAYVRLNHPDGGAPVAAAAADTVRRGSEGRGREGSSSNDKHGGEELPPKSEDVPRCSSSAVVDKEGTGAEAGGAAPASGGASGGASGEGEERVGDGGKGLYVQGMMVLCAPLLFVMPEVDAFYCFNSLLNQHMPRYVAANLDGVHAGCALVDRVLSMVDPVLFNYLESKFLTANIYAFPLVMSLHACVPPLEEAVKLWDAMFSFGVHLEVLVCVAQCVSLRDTLLQDPNPYRHLNARNLPPLDAELLVSMAFSLIPHLPAEMMDEIAQHPFLEEPWQGSEGGDNKSGGGGSSGGDYDDGGGNGGGWVPAESFTDDHHVEFGETHAFQEESTASNSCCVFFVPHHRMRNMRHLCSEVANAWRRLFWKPGKTWRAPASQRFARCEHNDHMRKAAGSDGEPSH